MSSFREIFEDYGADYQTTMTRFVNNKETYLRMLDMFLKDGSMLALGSALDAGNLRGAFEASHTLKGVSANMGLTPLYEAVCAIVEPLRAGEAGTDYQDLYGKIQAEMKRVEELRSHLDGKE